MRKPKFKTGDIVRVTGYGSRGSIGVVTNYRDPWMFMAVHLFIFTGNVPQSKNNVIFYRYDELEKHELTPLEKEVFLSDI